MSTKLMNINEPTLVTITEVRLMQAFTDRETLLLTISSDSLTPQYVRIPTNPMPTWLASNLCLLSPAFAWMWKVAKDSPANLRILIHQSFYPEHCAKIVSDIPTEHDGDMLTEADIDHLGLLNKEVYVVRTPAKNKAPDGSSYPDNYNVVRAKDAPALSDLAALIQESSNTEDNKPAAETITSGSFA